MLACSLLCIIITCVMSMDIMGKNSSVNIEKELSELLAKPDFAKPADVVEKSTKAFDMAISKDFPVEALQAAICLTIAQNSISSDSIVEIYGKLHRLPSQLKAPYTQVAYLLEANFLLSVYTHNRYLYNRRELPVEEISDNPKEWSGEQFRSRIDSLCQKALSDEEITSSTPLEDISPLISWSEAKKCNGLSIYDFIVYNIIRIHSEVGNEDHDSDTGLIEHLIKIDRERSADSEEVRDGALLLALSCRLSYLSDTSLVGAVDDMIREYKETPVYYLALSLIYRNAYGKFSESESQKFYKTICEATDEMAHIYGKESRQYRFLRYIQRSIASSDISFNSKTQVLPGETIKVSWRSSSCKDFYLLLVKVPSSYNDESLSYEKSLKVNDIKNVGKVVDSKQITLDNDLPFSAEGETEFVGVPAGYYVVVSASKPYLSSIRGNGTDFNAVNVSELTYISSWDAGENFVNIVSGINGAPVAGADVTLIDGYDRKKAATKVKTDAKGVVKLPAGNQYVINVKHGDNTLSFRDYISRYHQVNQSGIVSADILTDLPIYHPGDSIRCVGVVTKCIDNKVAPLADYAVKMVLYDANGDEKESHDLTTGKDGRVVCNFAIPSDVLTGTFRIYVSTSDGKEILGCVSVEVADYKAPTFQVTLETPEMTEENSAGPIKLKGTATTYSGVPVTDADVTVDVTFSSWWRYFSPEPSRNFSLKAVTDAEGNFEVEIDGKELRAESQTYGVFVAKASATSDIGETCFSEAVTFSLGEHYSLQVNIPERLEIKESEKEVSFPVKVLNAVGEQVKRKVRYEIEGVFCSDAKLQGEFDSGALSIPAVSLPSGEYKLTFTIEEPAEKGEVKADSVSYTTVIWRASDTKSPSRKAVWSPRPLIYAAPGARKVAVKVGSAYPDSYIYMLVSRSKPGAGKSADEILKVLRIDARMSSVEVVAPESGEEIKVTFCGVHDLEISTYSVTVRPADRNVQMRVVPETFRDRLNPMSHETWRFTLTADGQPVAYSAAMAVMSNKALNAITPFEWRFDPFQSCRYDFTSGVRLPFIRQTSTYLQQTPDVKYVDVTGYDMPAWNFYGGSLYSEYGIVTSSLKMLKIRGTSRNIVSNGNMMVESEEMDAVASFDMASPKSSEAILEESPVTSSGVDADEAAQGEDEKLRPVECPLAFFKPLLNGDGQGNIEVTFEVPDFNTEWQFRLIGYDPATMRYASTLLSAVASKPVMVQTNMPRFLRTGDKTFIEASAFNNSDETLDVSGVIEIFDPETGKILASRNFEGESLSPSSSRKFVLEYSVPDDLNAIAIRSRAISEIGSDGEQGVVPVLPAVQPVYDAETWYLSKGETEMSMKLPKMDEKASVTLEYCDNPVWYTLISLNGILNPDGESAMMLADAVYSNSVGAGILTRNPVLASALKRITASEDSLSLQSPLLKNQDLKLTALDVTPWVNNAASETERMNDIIHLTDGNRVQEALNSLMQRLSQLQGSDGGWSWVKGMPSSSFITTEVLWRFAAMQTTGDMPGDSEAMVKSGVAFCDKNMEKIWREAVAKGKKYPVSFSDVEYFFIRDRFEIPESDIISGIKRAAIKMVGKDWKDYDVSQKCVSAMMLFNAGENKKAMEIMESVRQFASSSPSKGVWFDGATGALSRTSPVLSAAIGLMAFDRILPGDKICEGIQQYLLLSRQTQDWQMSLSSAKVIIVAQALLSTFSPSEQIIGNQAKILIDGTPVDISEYSHIPGSFVVDLDPKKVSGKQLVISRPGGSPAWGGVMMSRIMPIKDIKPRAMEQIKIAKALYPVVQDGITSSVGKSSQRFKKGNRILVTLTITTDRDLDYLMIRDERGAWMQPREQLSGYSSQDGVWQVREQRTSCANIYIYHLTKGVHVLSYEVTADRDGEYTSGTATAQSQYYPLITARSGILEVTVYE